MKTTSTLEKSTLPTIQDQAVARVEKAIQVIAQGKLVLVQDDEDRENEADLVGAAEKISVASMAAMIRDCSGIVCLCLLADTAKELGLRPMVENNESKNQTAFTITVEARDGVTTGVSAADRVTTIRSVLNSTAQDKKFVSPGHIFPLAARAEGVLERRGHTEASVDLARLAGLKPAGVLCELTNPDGTMSCGVQVVDYARKHDMPIITVQDLVIYRQQKAC